MAKAGDDIERIILNEVSVYRMKDSPIDRLAFCAKSKITGEQYHAALRLYADAYGAGLMPTGVIDPAKERVDGGQYKNISDARIAAQVRYEHAIRRLSHDHFHILESIVIQEAALGEYAERFRRHKERRVRMGVALEKLCDALDALVRVYNPPRRDRGINSSHAPDYRPKIYPPDDPY